MTTQKYNLDSIRQILEIISVAIISGITFYHLDKYEEQKYLERISSGTIQFHVFTNNLDYWNFVIPIFIIICGLKLISAKIFNFEKTKKFYMIEGISIAWVCYVLGIFLTYVGDYYTFLGFGKFTMYKYLPNIGYPIYLLVLVPLFNLIFSVIFSRFKNLTDRNW